MAANQLWICGTCCQTPHYEKLSPRTTLARLGWNLNLDHRAVISLKLLKGRLVRFKVIVQWKLNGTIARNVEARGEPG